MDQEISDLIMFFGRFHPLVLHLPIGFLVIAFALEVLSRLDCFKQYKPSVGFILLLGVVSAVLAAGLGYMLAQAGGYNEELLFIHQWAGIVLACTAVVAYTLHWQLQLRRSVLLDRFYMAVMVAMMASLSVAGHFGGSLTHGSDYLTQYMPNGLRSIAGLPPKKSKEIPKITNLNEALIFDHIIYPIMDTRCISCHNESKSKANLMLHTREAILKGGESGEVLIAGNAQQSELIKRIHLPEVDEKHMPPKGKKQLTDEEIALLTWWINEEAPFDKTVAEVKVDEKVQSILNTLVDPDANKSEVEILLAKDVKPADDKILAQAISEGVTLMPVSADMNWLRAKVSPGNSGDSLVERFTEVAEQVIWLDLGNTITTDKIFLFINQFTILTRLHLENTKITDGLEHLNLLYLEYLNLYGTKVTDKGIRQLIGLKNLHKLYL